MSDLLAGLGEINPMLAYWPNDVHHCPACKSSWTHDHVCRELRMKCYDKVCCPDE